MKKLIVPSNYKTTTINGVVFTVEFSLQKSRERDWAPYDRLMVLIRDEAEGYISCCAITETVRAAVRFAHDMIDKGLELSPAAIESIARKSQMNLEFA